MSSPPQSTAKTSFPRRMLRASMLDAELYEEVEADRGATLQAACVVVLASAAAGVGALDNHGVAGVVWYTAAALAGWYVWALVACEIGTRLLPGPLLASGRMPFDTV